MRDPDRINELLKLISEIWHKNPDLRLCQLLGNCSALYDLYYLEDDKLQDELTKYLKELNLVEKFIEQRKEVVWLREVQDGKVEN